MDNAWRFIDSGLCGAFYNMALDEAIATLIRKGSSPPTLRFYGWDRPAVSLGCFQKAADIDIGHCEACGTPVVRRPTGGRAILHGDELTYSFSVKTDQGIFSKGLLDSYRKISDAFYLAFRKTGIRAESKRQREKGSVLAKSPLCFQSSSFGEIMVDNKKLVGSAQKRWGDGLLQQGSIPYSYNKEEMCGVFRIEKTALAEKRMTAIKEIMPMFDEAQLREMIRVSFEETFGVRLVLSPPSQDEMDLALELQERKYLQKWWNLRQ
jgi:lipoate-protein ligase A